MNLFGCVGYSFPEEDAINKIQAISVAEIAYIYEENRFSSNFDELRLSFNPETTNYSYKFIFIDEEKIVQFAAVAKTSLLRSYTGVVYMVFDTNKNMAEVKYIICKSDAPTRKLPDKVEWIDNKVNCPNGYSLIE